MAYQSYFKALFYAISMIGCIYQVSDILALYFQYEVVTETQMEIFAELKAPELNICFRYIDLFNYKQYSAETKVTFAFTNETPLEDKKRETFDTVTVADIFKYTPSVSNMYSSYKVKIPNSYDHLSFKGQNCDTVFVTRKYYFGEFICYSIQVQKFENDTFYYRQIGYSLTQPSVLFHVNLRSEFFHGADFIKVIMSAYCNGVRSCTYSQSANHPFPDTSYAYGTPVIRNYNSIKQIVNSNSYMVTYFTMSHNRLPPPYDTHCRDYTFSKKFIGKRDCYSQCLKKLTLTTFNKIPFSVPIGDALEFKHIGLNDIENSNTSHLLSQMDKQCYTLCYQDDCHSTFTVTRVLALKLGNNDLKLRVDVPKEPSLVIHYKAKFSFAEVIIYCCSCIGTWLGISFLNLPSIARSAINYAKNRHAHGRVIVHRHTWSLRNSEAGCTTTHVWSSYR